MIILIYTLIRLPKFRFHQYTLSVPLLFRLIVLIIRRYYMQDILQNKKELGRWPVLQRRFGPSLTN